jgi:dipeptidyl aminopeptidase
VVLIATVIFAALLGTLAGWSYSAPSYSIKGGNQHITLDHIMNGTFTPKSVTLDWVKQGMYPNLWLSTSPC